MRWKRILAAATSIWLGLMLCTWAYESMPSYPQPQHVSTPPDIQSIRELTELTVLAIQATEIVNAEASGYTGGISLVMLIRGTVTLGVDLKPARFVCVDQARKHLVLSLPQPWVRRVEIDPQETRVLSCARRGLWRLAVGAALEDRAFAEALVSGRDRLEFAALREDFTRQARDHAQAVIRRFVTELGWTLDIRWGG